MIKTAPAVGPVAKIVVVVGSAVMVFGFFGLLFIDQARTHPVEFFKWFGGGLIVHDALVAPLVAVVATLLTRWLPSSVKRHVQGALFASVVVALATFPLWRGYGRREDNPSVLPNDYTAGLLWVFGTIWLTAALCAAFAWWKSRKTSTA